ncbi:MAG: WGR domain-containing protein [Paracoccaceae bacterium]|nr:WGR domain-containing protein [Paracoccaceae bacterium]
MEITNPDPIHLQRVNPALNMARFYRLSVQPTLFGETSLMRCWGRIGTRGQGMMETFTDPGAAAAALTRLAAQKRRRGYLALSAIRAH